MNAAAAVNECCWCSTLHPHFVSLPTPNFLHILFVASALELGYMNVRQLAWSRRMLVCHGCLSMAEEKSCSQCCCGQHSPPMGWWLESLGWSFCPHRCFQAPLEWTTVTMDSFAFLQETIIAKSSVKCSNRHTLFQQVSWYTIRQHSFT